MSEDDGQAGITERVAAILAADAVGYTRLMADDEKATIAALDRARAVFTEHIEGNHGRVVDTAGDSVLSVFETTGGAVRAAVAIQEGLGALNEDVPEARRMQFRIGIHLGDIHEKADGTVYGDGVNVAARLEALSEPGGVTVSDSVHGSIRDRLDVGFAFIGEHEGKNLKSPVRAFRLLPEGAPAVTATKGKPKLTPLRALAGAGVIAVLVGALIWLAQAYMKEPGRSVQAPAADPVLAMPSGPTVAVLAFEDLGGDPEAIFAKGLGEDIVTALSRFGELRVVENNGRGADYVLEGSVRRAGDALRVAARLEDTRDGSQVWSEQFDRDLSAGAVFDIQDTITVAVATAIAGYNGAIARQILAEASGDRTNDLAAYECVLLVYVKHDSAYSEETFIEARECLEAAVARDSNYVDALAALSYLYGDAYSMGWARDLEDVDPVARSFDLASRAADLNPNSTAAHRSLALAHFYRHELGDFVEHADRALALNPHDPQTLGQLGSYLVMMGESERGAALVHKAYALNPDLPDWYNLTLAMERALAGDFEAALAHTNKVKDPNNYIAPLQRIIYLAHLDRLDEAGPDIERLNVLYPGYSIATMREEAAYWNNTAEFVSLDAAGLRKAGFPETSPEAPSRPVIAVLPFDNLSGDPEQEYFADGITEDIITRLAQFPDILVLGRNTTFQFKGAAVDVKEIGARLEADYIVEGSIRRAGETVRVNAQLLDVESGGHVWAETYDRALDPANLFAMQDEITEAVASRIGDPHGAIGRAEFQRSARQAPERLSSYECVLRYFEYSRHFSEETHRVARDCLEAVVESEPDYGEALAFLGNIYTNEVSFGFNASADSSLEKALDAIQRGVAIDPGSGPARAQLAVILYLTDNPKRALREAEEALRLDPYDAETIAQVAEVFANVGAYERAEEMMGKVTVLNPNYPVWMNWTMAKAHISRGEYVDAIRRLEMTQMGWYYWTRAYLAAAHCAGGDIARGREELEATLQARPDFAKVYWSEQYFWNKGPDVRPMIDAIAAGLEACGWDVPPDPGRPAR